MSNEQPLGLSAPNEETKGKLLRFPSREENSTILSDPAEILAIQRKVLKLDLEIDVLAQELDLVNDGLAEPTSIPPLVASPWYVRALRRVIGKPELHIPDEAIRAYAETLEQEFSKGPDKPSSVSRDDLLDVERVIYEDADRLKKKRAALEARLPLEALVVLRTERLGLIEARARKNLRAMPFFDSLGTTEPTALPLRRERRVTEPEMQAAQSDEQRHTHSQKWQWCVMKKVRVLKQTTR